MKRTITILTIALVGLSACTRENLAPEKQTGSHQLQFIMSPIKTAETRAVSTTAFDKNQTFGSTAFKLDATKTWLSDYASAESTDITSKEISYQGGVWKTTESYYWDDEAFQGKKLTFLSWAPFSFGGGTSSLVSSAKLSISTTTRDFSYVDWTMDPTPGYGYTKDAAGNYTRNTSDGSVDLLLAKSTDCTETNSSSGVLTQFVHQLCNVKFYASVVEEPTDGEQWHITKVVLSDIYTQADLIKTATPNVNTGIWSNHDVKSNYTYTPSSSIELTYDSSGKETEIFPQTLMLPQSVLYEAGTTTAERSPMITITYKDEADTEKTMSGYLAASRIEPLTTWLAGKSITYHIYISTVDYWIDFDVDASASAWDDNTTGTTITIGG